MKIIETGVFRSSDFYSTETSPLRTVARYELEYYDGGEGFSVVDGVKYPHAGRHFLLARPGDKRFSIGRFECRYAHFTSDEPEVGEIARCLTEPDDDSVQAMKELQSLRGLRRLAALCGLLDNLRAGGAPERQSQPTER